MGSKTLGQSSTFGPTVLALFVIGLLWLAATGFGQADLRIVEETEGMRTETLVKNNRIASPIDGGGKLIYYCDVGDIVMMSPAYGGQYWRGTMDEVRESFASLFDADWGLEDFDWGDVLDAEGLDGLEGFALGDLESLFADFLGPADDGSDVDVYIYSTGTAQIAGYDAVHYVIETAVNDEWRVFEEMWLAPALMAELTREVGPCVEGLFGLQAEMVADVGPFAREFAAVLASPEYKALIREGYPVRTIEYVEAFGVVYEIASDVVEVSRAPIPEDVFTIPPGYRRVDNLLDVLMADDM